MKANNLFVIFIVSLLFSYAGGVFADDIGEVSRVNINLDDAETMASSLAGIGLSRAEAIVAYREANGRFYSAEELSAVRGIGMRTVEKNADKIVVE
ncbi:MAG: helix-hairpin-helix domain-containing protein [Pseudomonadales bacterium]|nr:helix-hairpin-helix domain-containing protein [Pseudomonadales bacterium]